MKSLFHEFASITEITRSKGRFFSIHVWARFPTEGWVSNFRPTDSWKLPGCQTRRWCRSISWCQKYLFSSLPWRRRTCRQCSCSGSGGSFSRHGHRRRRFQASGSPCRRIHQRWCSGTCLRPSKSWSLASCNFSLRRSSYICDFPENLLVLFQKLNATLMKKRKKN